MRADHVRTRVVVQHIHEQFLVLLGLDEPLLEVDIISAVPLDQQANLLKILNDLLDILVDVIVIELVLIADPLVLKLLLLLLGLEYLFLLE